MTISRAAFHDRFRRRSAAAAIGIAVTSLIAFSGCTAMPESQRPSQPSVSLGTSGPTRSQSTPTSHGLGTGLAGSEPGLTWGSGQCPVLDARVVARLTATGPLREQVGKAEPRSCRYLAANRTVVVDVLRSKAPSPGAAYARMVSSEPKSGDFTFLKNLGRGVDAVLTASPGSSGGVRICTFARGEMLVRLRILGAHPAAIRTLCQAAVRS